MRIMVGNRRGVRRDLYLLLIFVSWISMIPYPASAQERGREMLFPQYYFFAERRLMNHTIKTVLAEDLDQCELLCYLNDDCVSLNIKKDRNNGEHLCELNNSTHLEDDIDLITDAVFYYRGSKNACGKNAPCRNNATCQSGFTDKGYRCSCTSGFEGEHCEKDIDECKINSTNCHVNANCSDTNGSYVCTCKPGYTGDGRNCTDTDECASKENKCLKGGANCTNTAGSYKCACQLGHLWNDTACEDIDECASSDNECAVGRAKCANTAGSYKCTCQFGSIWDGTTCKVDACQSYQNLTSVKRKTTNKVTSSTPCDKDIVDGKWYRFQGDAGTRMPTTCPNIPSCGTNIPGWLDGDPPTVRDEEKVMRVYFRRSNCNADGNYIRVRNCGAYTIYRLVPAKSCSHRYCGTD